MTQHYVYLFHAKKFVDLQEPVYKIGKTTKPNFERFNQYDEGAIFHFQMSCRDCHVLEKKIIALFKINYELHCGLEYFKGDRFEMIKDICRLILEEKEPEIIEEKEPEIIEEVVQYWSEEVVVNDEIGKVENVAENVAENDVSTTLKSHFCALCGFSSKSTSNLIKHFESKKHKDKIENPDAVIVGGFKCKKCDNIYKSNQGLWSHNKVCKAIAVPVAVPETDLRDEIKFLKEMITEIMRNQQTKSTT
jgi:predicted Zn-ribbon and HTH transcriptional regulator